MAQNRKSRNVPDSMRNFTIRYHASTRIQNIQVSLYLMRLRKLFLIVLLCDKTQESQLNNMKRKCFVLPIITILRILQKVNLNTVRES